MTDKMTNAPARKTPWHLWLIGALALLWSAIGCFDYLMTQTRNEAYMGQATQAQRDYFYGFPMWLDAAWAVAVWGGLLGAVFLLLRRRAAYPTFAASFVALTISSVYMYALSDDAEIAGAGPGVMSAAILVISLVLAVYARAMTRRGVLR